MSVDDTAAITEAMRQAMAAIQAHLRREEAAPLYLAGGDARRSVAVVGAAVATLRAAGRGNHLLACTGADIATLWRDTLRCGMTPFVRRSLVARDALLVAGVEALCEEPFAQRELARLITPGRLVILAGYSHLRHVAAWSPALARSLAEATPCCIHDGPCVTEADAWAIVDRVARYYGLTRATLLSRRRTTDVAFARQVTMLLLREEGLTYSRVGCLVRRNHATVLHGCRRIRQAVLEEPHVRYDLAALRCGTHAA